MDTNSTTIPEGETGHEERKVIDLKTAAADSRKVKIEAGKAGVRRHLKTFQATYKTLSDAALTFRERTSISYRECRDVVDALQALRKQTNACLEFLHGGESIFPGNLTSYFSATNSLYILDGEKTARLILEMDLFESLVSSTSNESLSHARQRIDMHVALQERLKDETKSLKELLGHLEQLLIEAPLPPIPCKST